MPIKERKANIYLAALVPFGVLGITWAFFDFPKEKLNAGLISFAFVTIFLSSYLRIQMPRTKIHLTISDALIILSFFVYGGSVAILLATLEAGYTSIRMRQGGGTVKPKTIILNMMIAANSVFVTTGVVWAVFGSIESVIDNAMPTNLIGLLLVMAVSQFLMNSVLVASAIAIRTEQTLWSVWNGYCLNVLGMYLAGSLMAGIGVVALQQINVFLFAVMIGLFLAVYITYRRYLDDIKHTSAKAERAERERAELAEKHVTDLVHYIEKLEKSTAALTESREKFRHAAYHDSLTGLPNRNKFIEVIEELLSTARSDPEYRFAILYLDLHSFKTVNDSLGHSMGDRLISQVAERLSKLVAEDDLVGRFGGDEFAVILRDGRSLEGVTAFAQGLVERIAEPFVLDERQIFTRASVGIAVGDAKYGKSEDILRDADMAMYEAKEKNRSYVIFQQKMHDRALSQLQIETDLRFAIKRNEFEIYYQPIVDLEGVRLCGFEALVRWNHPDLGKVEPDRFIPVSEATGLIVPMTIQILDMACRQLVEWQARPDCEQPLFVSVNISGKHFAHPNLVDHIRDTLVKTRINPHSLKLEITETAVMENAENAILMLRQIKDLGVQISIDDFGTGYSSLSYLQRFPIDTLKIDRAFVRSMEGGRQNGEIVRAVIALAETMKLTVVAEGIESIHQFHQLRILNCQYGQGYLFSRPLPKGEFEVLLSDRARWQTLVSGGTFAIVSPSHDYAETLIH